MYRQILLKCNEWQEKQCSSASSEGGDRDRNGTPVGTAAGQDRIISAIWKDTSRLCSALSRGSQVVS